MTHNVGLQLLLDGWALGLLTAVLAYLLGCAVGDWQARKRRKVAPVAEPTQAPPGPAPISIDGDLLHKTITDTGRRRPDGGEGRS